MIWTARPAHSTWTHNAPRRARQPRGWRAVWRRDQFHREPGQHRVAEPFLREIQAGLKVNRHVQRLGKEPGLVHPTGAGPVHIEFLQRDTSAPVAAMMAAMAGRHDARSVPRQRCTL